MTKKIRWDYNYKEDKIKFVTTEEFLELLLPLVQEPIESMEEFDGDLLMSDFQKLKQAMYKIQNALRELKKNAD